MFSKITIGKGQSKYDVIIGEGLCTKANFQKFVTKERLRTEIVIIGRKLNGNTKLPLSSYMWQNTTSPLE